LRVGRRSCGARTLHLGAGDWNGFHQRDGRIRSASAVRRRETFRFRSRARRYGHSRIHKHENDLDFLVGLSNKEKIMSDTSQICPICGGKKTKGKTTLSADLGSGVVV